MVVVVVCSYKLVDSLPSQIPGQRLPSTESHQWLHPQPCEVVRGRSAEALVGLSEIDGQGGDQA